MKKILLVMLILSFVLCACEDKKSDNDVTNNVNNIEQTDNNEYKNPDFTDKTDFKINTSSDIEDIYFDKIVLHDESNAQLDLKFSQDRVGSLFVTKQEIDFDEDEISTFSIGGEEVSYYKAIDDMNHYIWSKDNFYFEFTSINEFTNEEIAKIVKGYSAQVGANNE